MLGPQQPSRDSGSRATLAWVDQVSESGGPCLGSPAAVLGRSPKDKPSRRIAARPRRYASQPASPTSRPATPTSPWPPGSAGSFKRAPVPHRHRSPQSVLAVPHRYPSLPSTPTPTPASIPRPPRSPQCYTNTLPHGDAPRASSFLPEKDGHAFPTSGPRLAEVFPPSSGLSQPPPGSAVRSH